MLIPLLFILFSAFLSYQEVILYSALQAKRQVLILLKARPITTYLLDDVDYPDSLKTTHTTNQGIQRENWIEANKQLNVPL